MQFIVTEQGWDILVTRMLWFIYNQSEAHCSQSRIWSAKYSVEVAVIYRDAEV